MVLELPAPILRSTHACELDIHDIITATLGVILTSDGRDNYMNVKLTRMDDSGETGAGNSNTIMHIRQHNQEYYSDKLVDNTATYLTKWRQCQASAAM